MRIIFKALPMFALALLSSCQAVARDPLLRLMFHVVDDEAKNIEGAKVSFSAEARPRYVGDESGRQNGVSGLTDKEGRYTGEVEAWDATQSGYQATKDGYYPVWSSYSARGKARGKWQPWNPTIKVVLKRIKNPVPMYAKRLALSLPKLNEPVGYDFVIGDWVAPYGRGTVADMTFVGNSRKEGDRRFNWELNVTFSNPGSGIQRFRPESESLGFRSAYEAPPEGYLTEWKLRRWRHGPEEAEQTTFDGKAGYYFRVRTELDEEGNVVKALYGKIYGDFFDMVYYLNPDGTRNMEFDPKRNLLKPPTNRERSNYQVAP